MLTDITSDLSDVKHIEIDAEKNLLLVKGPVPGANDGYLYIRPATRLFKRKAKKLAK